VTGAWGNVPPRSWEADLTDDLYFDEVREVGEPFDEWHPKEILDSYLKVNSASISTSG